MSIKATTDTNYNALGRLYIKNKKKISLIWHKNIGKNVLINSNNVLGILQNIIRTGTIKFSTIILVSQHQYIVFIAFPNLMQCKCILIALFFEDLCIITCKMMFDKLIYTISMKLHCFNTLVLTCILSLAYIFYSLHDMIFRSPESLRWPIAMGWRPSSCVVSRASSVVRRASSVNIFFS